MVSNELGSVQVGAGVVSSGCNAISSRREMMLADPLALGLEDQRRV